MGTKKETPDADYYYRLGGNKVVEMAKENENGTVRYVFIYDADGNPHELHYYTGYDDTTPTKYFYVLNLQGDVIQLRDTSNAVVANYTYDAWGRLISVKSASGATISDASHIANVNPIRYRGYFYDTEIKLYYCNSRYYDPQVKRFINADAYVSTGQGFIGFNMFAYCGNNPVVYGDITGNMYVREAGALGSSGNWDGEATDPITKHRLDLEWKQYVIRNLHTHTTHNPKHIFSPESNSEIHIDLSDFWTDSKAIEHEKEDFFEDFVADLGTTDSDESEKMLIYGFIGIGKGFVDVVYGGVLVAFVPSSIKKATGVYKVFNGIYNVANTIYTLFTKEEW